MQEVTVFRTWDEPIADMAVDLLRSEGIKARKRSNATRSVHPFTMDGLGEIEIVVPENEKERGLEIIEVRFSEGDSNDMEESSE